jgi:hypothetical protein
MNVEMTQHKPYEFTKRKKCLEIRDNETRNTIGNYTTKSNLLNEWERIINFSGRLNKVYTGRLNYVGHFN